MTETLRDVVFFFGYVQLSAEERKYSAANKDSAQKLADVNGKYKSISQRSFPSDRSGLARQDLPGLLDRSRSCVHHTQANPTADGAEELPRTPRSCEGTIR